MGKLEYLAADSQSNIVRTPSVVANGIPISKLTKLNSTSKELKKETTCTQRYYSYIGICIIHPITHTCYYSTQLSNSSSDVTLVLCPRNNLNSLHSHWKHTSTPSKRTVIAQISWETRSYTQSQLQVKDNNK